MRSLALVAVLACVLGATQGYVQHMFLSRGGYVLWTKRDSNATKFWSTPQYLTTTTYNKPRRMSVCKDSSSSYSLIVPYFDSVGTPGVKRIPLTWNDASKPSVGAAQTISISGASWGQPAASMCPSGVAYIADQTRNTIYKVNKGSNSAHAYVAVTSTTQFPSGIASDSSILFWSSNVLINNGGGIYKVSTNDLSVTSGDITKIQNMNYPIYIDSEPSGSNPWVWFTEYSSGNLYKTRSDSTGSNQIQIASNLGQGSSTLTCVATDAVADQVFISVQSSGLVKMVASTSSSIQNNPQNVLWGQTDILAISVYNSDAALPTGTSVVVILATIVASLRLMF